MHLILLPCSYLLSLQAVQRSGFGTLNCWFLFDLVVALRSTILHRGIVAVVCHFVGAIVLSLHQHRRIRARLKDAMSELIQEVGKSSLLLSYCQPGSPKVREAATATASQHRFSRSSQRIETNGPAKNAELHRVPPELWELTNNVGTYHAFSCQYQFWRLIRGVSNLLGKLLTKHLHSHPAVLGPRKYRR